MSKSNSPPARPADRSPNEPSNRPASRTNSASGTAPAKKSGNQPVHTIRYRNLKGTIWRNSGAKGDFYSVTLSRSYQDDQEQ
ncbi:MAG TPA: hypothetical protein PK402_06885, partial [Tepidisphaeraceae bacterium]|nr:hypothetical protein [Tepidisphaeraceae bacterium]